MRSFDDRDTQLNWRSVKSVLFTTEISIDLSTYSLFRARWNPAFPTLIYVPITFYSEITRTRLVSQPSAAKIHIFSEIHRLKARNLSNPTDVLAL